MVGPEMTRGDQGTRLGSIRHREINLPLNLFQYPHRHYQFSHTYHYSVYFEGRRLKGAHKKECAKGIAFRLGYLRVPFGRIGLNGLNIELSSVHE